MHIRQGRGAGDGVAGGGWVAFGDPVSGGPVACGAFAVRDSREESLVVGIEPASSA